MTVSEARPVPPLTDLYVYVTDDCNCSCEHCWIVARPTERERSPRRYLAPDLLEAALLEAKPLGLLSLKWTGGEPTIHPDFAALLEIQKKFGISGRMETNGMEITPELARRMSEAGVNHVAVSLDGATPATHDAVRGVRGAFSRALGGIAHLVAAGYRPQVIMCLMRHNVGELDSLLALAVRVGAGSVKLNPIQPTLRGADIHSRGKALTVRETLDVQRWVLQEAAAKHGIPIHVDVPLAFRPVRGLVAAGGCSACGIKTILGLLADGSYALCGIGEVLPGLVFGKAGLGELPRIWREHPVLLELRDGIPRRLKGVCGACLMKKVCLGACVAQNYYRSHDLLQAFWFCEQAERDGLFPRSRLKPGRFAEHTSRSRPERAGDALCSPAQDT